MRNWRRNSRRHSPPAARAAWKSQRSCSQGSAGKTKEGVGIGWGLKDVEKALGKPDVVFPAVDGWTEVRYDQLGLHLKLLNDKLVELRLEVIGPPAEEPKDDIAK